MIVGLQAPFADVTYADSVCTTAVWTAADQSTKESALQYSRIYIQDTYYCNFDLDEAPDQVKTASSLLAELHISADIFAAQNAQKPAIGLTGKSVEAKGVKTSKNYDAQSSRRWVDPFPQISAILIASGYCTLNKGGIRTVTLVRR